jgi:hypothetical protein
MLSSLDKGAHTAEVTVDILPDGLLPTGTGGGSVHNEQKGQRLSGKRIRFRREIDKSTVSSRVNEAINADNSEAIQTDEEIYWQLIEEISIGEDEEMSKEDELKALLSVRDEDYISDEEIVGMVQEFDKVYGEGGFLEAFEASEECFEVEWSNRVREILDSGCSFSMSNMNGRLRDVVPASKRVSGANGSPMRGYEMGRNKDGVMELRVEGMAPRLVLLSLAQYASKGVFVANGNGGSVFQVPEEVMTEVLEDLRLRYKEILKVQVVNGVYEVVERGEDLAASVESLKEDVQESAMLSTHFFNSKLQFTDAEQVILGNMLMPFTFRALKKMVQKKLVTGLDPRLTPEAFDEFEKNHGTTPEFFQGSLKKLMGNLKADEGAPLDPKVVGEYVSIDSMFPDYNQRKGEKTEKIPTVGGATGAKLVVDGCSGFLMLKLFSKGTKSEEVIKWLFQSYESVGHKVKMVGADSWEVSVSDLRLFDTEDLQLIFNRGARFMPTEAHNHSNGGQWYENGIMLVKQRTRGCFRFVFANPHVFEMGWTVPYLCKLWGEAFHNAVNAINLTESPRNPGKSRWEVFLGEKPDMQQIRMLPMFAVVQVWNYNGDKEHYTGQPHFVEGLVCGTDMKPPLQMPAHGVIRAAILDKVTKKIKVVATSKYLPPTLGGGLNIQKAATGSVEKIIEGQGVGHVNNPTEPTVECEVIDISNTSSDEVIEAQQRGDNDIKDGSGEQAEQSGKLKKQRLSSKEAVNQEKAALDKRIKKLEEEIRDERVTVLLKAQKVNPTKTQVKKARQRLKTVDKYMTAKPYKTGPQDRDRRAKLRALVVELERLRHLEDSASTESNPLFQYVNEVMESPMEEGNISWYDMKEEDIYFSLTDLCLYEFYNEGSSEGHTSLFTEDYSVSGDEEEEVFKAVTENIPRNFNEACTDKVWGEPARKEMSLLKDKVMVKVSRDEAQKMIKEGCDIVRLFPVYEKKFRDGIEVYKVRLVADGRTHKPEGPTYAATPSREEFLILLHLVAHGDWDWAHIDESRAFTGAQHTDSKPVLVKISGDTDFWRVINALYGLKTAPLDYQKKATARLIKLGYTRKEFCSNTFVKYVTTSDGNKVMVLVYGYVDDYFFACADKDALKIVVEEFRKEVVETGTNTTDPIYNPTEGLGMEFERIREKRIILVRMAKKIIEVGERFLSSDSNLRRVKLPISDSEFLVREEQFVELPEELQYKARFLDPIESNEYLSIVGSLIWINGVRFDAGLGITYLTWFSHLPRVHHLEVARRVLGYLVSTVLEPLVLGGSDPLEVITQTDAALGTGPKLRSVIAEFTTLGKYSGAINAKVTATDHIPLSSFESELYGTEQAYEENERMNDLIGTFEIDGVAHSFKTSSRVSNVLTEMEQHGVPRIIYGDNEKAIEFVKREVETKNIRHANLRLWYMRVELANGGVLYEWKSGKLLEVNALTKPVKVDEQTRLRWSILGHKLLGHPEPIVTSTAKRVPLLTTTV